MVAIGRRDLCRRGLHVERIEPASKNVCTYIKVEPGSTVVARHVRDTLHSTLYSSWK